MVTKYNFDQMFDDVADQRVGNSLTEARNHNNTFYRGICKVRCGKTVLWTYNQSCPKCLKLRQKQRNVDNPMFNNARYHIAIIRRRAKSLNLPCDLTIEFLRQLYVNNPTCPVLNVPIVYGKGINDYSPSIDRVDPCRGYLITNIEFMSVKANRMKNNASLDELEKLVAFLKQKGKC